MLGADDDNELLSEAVYYLANSEDFDTLSKTLATVVHLDGVGFYGSRSVLNPLVVLGRRDEQTLQAILVGIRSELAGPRESKKSYQRELMANTRRREGMAVELQALKLGRPLTKHERLAFVRRTTRAWAEAKKKRVEGLPYFDRLATLTEFWDEIEANLEREIARLKEAKS